MHARVSRQPAVPLTALVTVLLGCLVALLMGALPARAAAAADTPTQTFNNGSMTNPAILYDTSGYKVDAHSGHISFFGDRYYLYGDSYSCGFAYNQNNSAFCGVKVYESTDLTNWTYDGYALNTAQDATAWRARCGGQTYGCYRPKVIYNATTHLYVMWLNESTGSDGAGYLVSTSPTPTGPFTLLSHVRMTYDRCTQPGAFSFGDEDLFVDDDGTAYLAYTSINGNCGNNDGLADHNIAVERLNSDYTAGMGAGYYTVFNRPYGIEAPVLFKRKGVYYLLYSDPMCPYCTTANTSYATTKNLAVPFTNHGNLTPAKLGGQPTAVTAIAANGSVQYLFMLDRWQQGVSYNLTNQFGANYFFAPLSFGAGGDLLPIPAVNSWQSRVQAAPGPAETSAAPRPESTFVPLSRPTRIVDTRIGLGGVRSPITANRPYTFGISNLAPNATALVVNITAADAAGAGNIRVWGSGAMPSTSNVNYSPQRPTAPNATTVPIAGTGTLFAYAQGAAANLIIDVEGYYTSTSTYRNLTPAQRIFDSRRTAQPIPAHGTLDVDLFATGAIPRTATALTANLTVVATAGGNLQAYDPAQPTTGQTVKVVYGPGDTPNLAMMPVPQNGILRFANASDAPVQLIVDAQGYDTGTSITLLPNAKRLQSVSAPQVGYYTQLFQPQLTYQFDTRPAGVPAAASAVIVEIGASPASGGYATTAADQDDIPTASNLNFAPGLYQSNLAIVPLNHGMFEQYFYASNPVDFSIDVVGYVN